MVDYNALDVNSYAPLLSQKISHIADVANGTAGNGQAATKTALDLFGLVAEIIKTDVKILAIILVAAYISAFIVSTLTKINPVFLFFVFLLIILITFGIWANTVLPYIYQQLTWG